MTSDIVFTDSHCHLDFDDFSEDLVNLLAQCNQQKISRIVVPSISPDNWQNVLTTTAEHSKKHCQLLPCLGIHPWFLNDLTEQSLIKLSTMCQQHQNKIVAIGEAGIDGTIAKEFNNMAKQELFFEYQLQLANELDKPIIVHHRRSHSEVSKLLRQVKPTKAGIIHAFSGSYQQAKQYLDLGFKLGVGGTITYDRAEKTRKTIKKLPIECLVLETDAPAMPLSGYQGKVNSPLKIVEVFNHLCLLRAEKKETLAHQLEENINNIFTL